MSGVGKSQYFSLLRFGNLEERQVDKAIALSLHQFIDGAAEKSHGVRCIFPRHGL